MGTHLAARRRDALSKGYRFVIDKCMSPDGQVTGFHGFVVTSHGSISSASVHDTEEQLFERLLAIVTEFEGRAGAVGALPCV